MRVLLLLLLLAGAASAQSVTSMRGPYVDCVPQAATPTSVEGRLFYEDSSGHLFVYDGTGWLKLSFTSEVLEHTHTSAATGGDDLLPDTVGITTSLTLPNVAPASARRIGFNSGVLQWHDGTAARTGIYDVTGANGVTSTGTGATRALDLTYGTSANTVAMGSRTLTLSNGDGSLTFSAAQPVGANMAFGITPTFGTSDKNFAEGDVTATLTAGTNISITGTASQAIGANHSWTINTTGVPTGSGTANQLAYWTSSSNVGALGAATNGQLPIGSTGAAPVLAALTGTANRVTVTNGAGTITLSGPQDIAAGSSPTFAGLTLSGFSGAVSASAGVLSAGTLSIANGGTGQVTAGAAFDALDPMTTLGDTIYGGASGTATRLAGNTTTTRNFLRQTGDGANSAAPAWDTVTKTDVGLSLVENTALSTWGGSTNLVTLGTVATGTWSATTVAVNKGGTGQTSYTDGQLLIGNTTGNTLAKATLTAGAGVVVTNGSGAITVAANNADNFANPTASLGLTAVNGSATTWMRSDGAPALSQAIIPTWTGLHTFKGSGPGFQATFQSPVTGQGEGLRFLDNAGSTSINWFIGAQFNVANGLEFTPSTVGGGTTFSTPALQITTLTSTFNRGLTINEVGADSDTRIEGDTQANLIFVDASTDRVGEGTNTPAYNHDTVGVIAADTLHTIPAASAYQAAVNGFIWSDSDNQALATQQAGVQQQLVGCFFTQTTTVTVSNDAAETTLVGAGTGTATIPANFWKAGKKIRIEAWGYYGTQATPVTFNMRLRLGGVAGTIMWATGDQTPGGGLTNQAWYAKSFVTCRSTGTRGQFVSQGEWVHHTTATDFVSWQGINTAVVELDTTAAKDIALTADWAAGVAAADTITCLDLSAEVLN